MNALPPHQRQPARFALATGLRQANVLQLKWPEVDLARRTAWVHADEAKGREAIGVPLNDEAMAVLNEEKGKHPERVFTYKGRPLGQLNTRSWRNGLKRAGIGPHPRRVAHLFRHSLATRMIRHGASMAEIAEVLRHRSQTTTAIYAKVSFEALRTVARPWPVGGGVR